MSPNKRQWKMNKDLEQEFSQSTFEGQRHQILQKSSISKLSNQNQDEGLESHTLEQKFDSISSSSNGGGNDVSPIDDQSMFPMNQTFQKLDNSQGGRSIVESVLSDFTQHKPNPQSTMTDLKFQMQKVASKTVMFKKEKEQAERKDIDKQARDTSLSIFVIP